MDLPDECRRYEYKVLDTMADFKHSPGYAGWQPYLNGLGEQGWELVQVLQYDADEARYWVFLRRRDGGRIGGEDD